MLRRPLQKIKNPQIGIYSVRYRTSKGTFTGQLSAATSFQYVTKNGNLSKQFEIPAELKLVHPKKLYIDVVLAKIINANEKRKESSNRKKGKEYQKKRPEELLNISLDDLEILRAEFPEIFPRPDEDYYELVTNKEFQQRIIRASKLQKKYGLGLWANRFTARTDGRKTPEVSGKPVNWVELQKKSGFISEVTITEERQKENKKTGKVTTYKVKKKTLRGDGSIMFFFTRVVRQFFLDNRKVFTSKVDGDTSHSAFKLGIVTDLVIHDDFMLSDQTFYLPRKMSAKTYKRRIDGMVWGMAQEAFRMINDDFPFDDQPKGGLTSDDIFTKIRFTDKLDKIFSMLVSIIGVPYKKIPDFVKPDEYSGYLKKSAKNKAFYEEEEEE